MQGLARILRAGQPDGAGFLSAPARVTTCAHVVNLALGRDIRADGHPGEDAVLTLDFPNDLDAHGAAEQRRAQVLADGWHAPTAAGRPPGRQDDIAILALDAPLPAERVPERHRAGTMPEHGTELAGWGVPQQEPAGLWAPAILSGARGILRQVDLKPGRPELARGFSGGPVCADERLLGMLLQLDEAQGIAWILPIEALEQAWARLRLIELRLEVRDARLFATPDGPAAGSDLDALRQGVDQGRFDALLDALAADGRDLRRRLIDAPAAADGAARPDPAEPLRLRLRCADPALLDLPWHCLAGPDGRRLGGTTERPGWVIEVTADAAAPGARVELDRPLILAPASNGLADGVNVHVEQVAAALTGLLGQARAPVTWAINALDLEDALSRQPPPDLLYCYAQIDTEGALRLGRDAAMVEPLPLPRLLESIQAAPPRLLWLHLAVAPNQVDRRAILAQTAGFPLVVLQTTHPRRAGVGLQQTLFLLNALGEARRAAPGAPAEPAAVFSRHAGAQLRVQLGADGLALSPAADAEALDRALIRASLIQLLLGRTAEKDALAGRIADPSRRLFLYHACGERAACVHDFPDQGRWHLEDSDQTLTVRQRRLRGLMQPDPDPLDLEDQLVETLGYDPATEGPADALRRIARGIPSDGETVLISLAWLLEPDPALSAEQAIAWVKCWKQVVLGLFPADQIPQRLRLLAGICLQWRDDWPGRVGSTADRLQRRAADQLDRRRPAHCDWVRIETPLDQLKHGELVTFFQRQRRRHCLRGLDPEDLADWVADQTDGAFEPSVDLIYSGCKEDFAALRRR